MNNIPDKVNEVVSAYLNLVEVKLPNLIDGFYIYGSVSLGAFDYGFSDIDFVSVSSRKVSDEDLKILKEIHKQIKKEYPKTDLMGIYVMKQDLQWQHKNEKTCPCFIDGVFKGLEKFEKNSIDAHQLKKYGITIRGQAIETLDYTVDWNILIHNMKENLNTYWLNWVKGCERFPSLKHICSYVRLGSIEWGVLGVTRLYYTFNEKDITSKIGAGEYALKTFPEKWHRIINEAMRLRKNNKNSYYNSVFERRKDALDYMKFVIQECNSLVK